MKSPESSKVRCSAKVRANMEQPMNALFTSGSGFFFWLLEWGSSYVAEYLGTGWQNGRTWNNLWMHHVKQKRSASVIIFWFSEVTVQFCRRSHSCVGEVHFYGHGSLEYWIWLNVLHTVENEWMRLAFTFIANIIYFAYNKIQCGEKVGGTT